MLNFKELFNRRRKRTRFNIAKLSGGRLRLSVFRSGKHIYAQVIDDRKGVTLASASSIDKGLREKLKKGGDTDAAKAVGALVASYVARLDRFLVAMQPEHVMLFRGMAGVRTGRLYDIGAEQRMPAFNSLSREEGGGST